jgi:hypothetical protein
MTIKVGWHNPERTVILQKREPGWTWEDFDAAVDQYAAMTRSVDHKVAIIIDCLDAPEPPDPHALNHYRRAMRLKPKNLVLMVIVSVGGFLENMGNIFVSSITPDRQEFLQFVRSMEEAEALVTEVLTPSASAAG